MSAASSIAAEIVTQLLTKHVDIVSRKWLPSFTADQLADAQITVRPVSRNGVKKKTFADREAQIEVSLIQQLPGNTDADSDPFNDFTTIDAFDDLSETVLDYFLPDPDPEHHGFLSQVAICGYRPRTVEQVTLIDAELLRTKRQLLTIIVITYQRLG